MVQLPNIGEFIEVVFALFRIGALPVYALPAHRETEIGYFCSFAEATAYVIPDRHAGFDHRALAAKVKARTPSLRHVFVVGDPAEHTALSDVPCDPVATPDGPKPHELAFLQLSGGTTGVPKLIPRTHDDYLYSLWGSNEICGVDADTRYLVALPAAHNFPMSSPGWLGVLYAGGTAVLCPRPDPATAFPLIERERITMTGLVPPLALVWTEAAPESAYDLSSLDVVLVGGAKYSEQAARRLEPALGCRLQQVFGMAEGLVNYTRLDDDQETVVTTQGRPISPDDEIRIVDAAGQEVAEGEFGHLLTRGRTRSAATGAPRNITRRPSPRAASTAPATSCAVPGRATSSSRAGPRTRSTGAARRSRRRRSRTSSWPTPPCTTSPSSPCPTTTSANAPSPTSSCARGRSR